MLNRIFGLETEYGLLVNQDRPEYSPSWVAQRIRDHIFVWIVVGCSISIIAVTMSRPATAGS